MATLSRIHINQHKIKSNLKHGKNEPVITVKNGKNNVYGHEVEIQGPSKVVYQPAKPLSCGARVWISCECPVDVVIYEENEDAHQNGKCQDQVPKRKRISLV